MATLTGKKIKNTYDALIKNEDNNTVSSTAKQLTDGLGNSTPLYLSSTQLGIGVTPSFQLHTSSSAKIGGDLTVTGNLTVDGTTTIIDSTIIAVGDNMIELAKDNVANIKDIGWYGTIVESGTKYVGAYYDASSGVTTPTFYIGLGTNEPGSTAAWTVKGKLVIGAIDSTGGTFSGQITIPETPTADGHAASKKYVDDSVNGLVDGSGTANDVVMWSDSDTLTDAPIAISGSDATFAGNVESQDTFILNYNNAGNKWQQLFDGSNNWNLRYYNGSGWSINYLNISTTGNATFSGDIIGSGNLNLRSYNNSGKGIFFRDGFEYGDDYPYNLSITIYDDGDGAADALEINAYDGIYFNTGSNTRNVRVEINNNGNVTFHEDVFTDTVQISNGTSYNENIRMFPSASNDYSSIIIGAVSGTSGTGDGQWTLVRYPDATYDNKFAIRHNTTDIVTILKNQSTSFSGDATINGNIYSNLIELQGIGFKGGEGDILDSSTFGKSGIGNTFRWVEQNSASTGSTWRKVCDVTLNTSFFDGVQMEVVVYQPNTNWGDSASFIKNYYSVAFRGSQSDVGPFHEDAIVYGINADLLRVYKVSTNNYELQARTSDDNRDLIVEYTITSKNNSKVTPNDSYTAATISGGTAYTASANSNTKTKFAGEVEFQGTTIGDDLRVNGILYLGAGADTTYGGYLTNKGAANEGISMKVHEDDGFDIYQVWGNAGEAYVSFEAIDGDIKLYSGGSQKLKTTSAGIDISGDINFTRASTRKIIFNSDTNFGSDLAFLYFNEDSTFHRTGTENVRFSIGAFNDFSNASTHSDAVDIQGGSRLYLNTGDWDSELDSAIGTPATGAYLDDYPIQFAVNNDVKVKISNTGDIIMGANYIGRDTDNYIDFSTDNEIDFKVGGGVEITLDASQLYPVSNFGSSLGHSSYRWNYIYGRYGNFSVDLTTPLLTLSDHLVIENGNSTYSVPAPANTNVPLIYLRNTNNTASTTTAHSIITLRTQINGGDPFIAFDVEDETGWTAGMDNSDNKFKITTGWNNVGGTTGLIISTTGELDSPYFATYSNVNSTGDGGVFIKSGQRLGFDEGNVRSWTMKAASGQLNFYSGDGAGAVYFFQPTLSVNSGSAQNLDVIFNNTRGDTTDRVRIQTIAGSTQWDLENDQNLDAFKIRYTTGGADVIILNNGSVASTIVTKSTGVGINTASIDERLTVNGNTQINDALLFKNTTSGIKWQFYRDGNETFNLRYNSGSAWSSNAISVKTNNRVGINTTDPQTPLHVSGTGSDGNAMLRMSASGGTTTFNWASSTLYPNLAVGCTMIHLFGKAQSTKNQGYIGFKYAGDGSNDNRITLGHYASNHLMNIFSDGRVAIGTETPFSTAKLQVKTATNVNLAFQTGTTETSGFKLNAFNDAANANIPLELNGSVTLLKTGEAERMRIDANGRVFINSGHSWVETFMDQGIRIKGSRAGTILESTGTLATHVMIAGSNSSTAIHINHSSAGALGFYQYSAARESLKLHETGMLELKKGAAQLKLTDSDDNKFAEFSYSSSFLSIRNNSTNATHFQMDESGRVRIGRSSSTEKLDIQGNVKIYPESSSWAEGLSFSMPTQAVWGGIRWRRERSGSDGNHYIGYVGNYSNDDLVFGSNTGGTQKDYNLAINKDGRVTFGGTSYEGTSQVTMQSSKQYTLTIQHNKANASTVFDDALFVKNTNQSNSNWTSIGFSTNGTDGQHHRAQIRAYKGGGSYEGQLRFFMRQTNANNDEKYRFYANGEFHADSDIVAFSTTISDKRLKDNVITIDGALNKVKKLRGVEYVWNNGSKKGKKDLGVIAQEVEEILPEIVTEKEMAFFGEEKYKTVDYEKLTAVLIESVKELSAKVEALENKNCNCK